MSYEPKVYREQGGDKIVVASGGEINIESGGTVTADGTQASTIADAAVNLKTDYAVDDIDDAGTIDGTEIAVVLNLITAAYNDLATKHNTLLAAIEGVGILATE